MLPYLSTQQEPLNSRLGKQKQTKKRFYERKISNKQFPLKRDSGKTKSTTMSCTKVLGAPHSLQGALPLDALQL